MELIANEITNMISKNIEKIDDSKIEMFDDIIFKAKKIFIVGAGRSGLVGKFFAVRLMHMGKSVFIVGETCTPRIDENSVLIVISSSGKTPSIVNICNIANESNAKVVLFTSNEKSCLVEMSDLMIKIELGKKVKRFEINATPMGTEFEITTLILLESFVGKSIHKYEMVESVLAHRHTNLE